MGVKVCVWMAKRVQVEGGGGKRVRSGRLGAEICFLARKQQRRVEGWKTGHWPPEQAAREAARGLNLLIC
jgi:hypothetical protein